MRAAKERRCGWSTLPFTVLTDLYVFLCLFLRIKFVGVYSLLQEGSLVYFSFLSCDRRTLI